MTDENIETIEVVTQDGKKIEVEKRAILMSLLVKDMLEEETDDDKPCIPLPNVDSVTFQKILEFLNHHWNNPIKEIEKPLKRDFNEMISDWDKKFLESMDDEFLVNVINASNYLNIKDLLEMTCAKVAASLKGKPVSELRAMFMKDDEEDEDDDEEDGEDEDDEDDDGEGEE